MKRLVPLMIMLALTACKQDQPAPSQKIAEAAGQLMAKASGDETPTLGEGPYAPRDECTDIPGADEFRQQLASVVKERDVEGLVALAANDVRLDFGGGAGANLLRTHLTSKDRDLWTELEQLLPLGCAKNSQGGITIPWYFGQDFGDIDPMMGMIITGENVPVMSGPPSEDAAVGKVSGEKPAAKPEEIRKLSWDVVKLLDGYNPEEPYQKVQLQDGTLGYIATGKLRSLVDYRLIASSRNGKWSITSLVAGD